MKLNNLKIIAIFLIISCGNKSLEKSKNLKIPTSKNITNTNRISIHLDSIFSLTISEFMNNGYLLNDSTVYILDTVYYEMPYIRLSVFKNEILWLQLEAPVKNALVERVTALRGSVECTSYKKISVGDSVGTFWENIKLGHEGEDFLYYKINLEEGSISIVVDTFLNNNSNFDFIDSFSSYSNRKFVNKFCQPEGKILKIILTRAGIDKQHEIMLKHW